VGKEEKFAHRKLVQSVLGSTNPTRTVTLTPWMLR